MAATSAVRGETARKYFHPENRFGHTSMPISSAAIQKRTMTISMYAEWNPNALLYCNSFRTLHWLPHVLLPHHWWPVDRRCLPPHRLLLKARACPRNPTPPSASYTPSKATTVRRSPPSHHHPQWHPTLVPARQKTIEAESRADLLRNSASPGNREALFPRCSAANSVRNSYLMSSLFRSIKPQKKCESLFYRLTGFDCICPS